MQHEVHPETKIHLEQKKISKMSNISLITEGTKQITHSEIHNPL